MQLDADKRVLCSRINSCKNENELKDLIAEIAEKSLLYGAPALDAYAYGVVDGYAIGSENNTYEEDILRYYYRLGYNRGVFLYCETLEGE